MSTREEILSVPCPTCKRAADSPCWDERDPSGEGIHLPRIHRFEIVTDAIAHNEALENEEQR